MFHIESGELDDTMMKSATREVAKFVPKRCVVMSMQDHLLRADTTKR